jgi:hypothetical protein
MCTCKVGPGKFEGEGADTFLLHAICGECPNNDICYGDRSWAAIVARPIVADPDSKAEALKYGYCQKCINKAASAMAKADGGGYSVGEDSQGFAWSINWETFAKAEKALADDLAEQQAGEEEE